MSTTETWRLVKNTYVPAITVQNSNSLQVLPEVPTLTNFVDSVEVVTNSIVLPATDSNSGVSKLSELTIDAGSTNGPNQLVQLDENGELVANIVNRVGTRDNGVSEVFSLGEFYFTNDDDRNLVLRGDGSTAGGLLAFSTPVHFKTSNGLAINVLSNQDNLLEKATTIASGGQVKAGELWSIKLTGLAALNDESDFADFDIAMFSKTSPSNWVPTASNSGSFFNISVSTGELGSSVHSSIFGSDFLSQSLGSISARSIMTPPAGYSGFYLTISGLFVVPANGELVVNVGFAATPTGNAGFNYSGILQRIK